MTKGKKKRGVNQSNLNDLQPPAKKIKSATEDKATQENNVQPSQNIDNADSKYLRQCIEKLDICFWTITKILDAKKIDRTTKEILSTYADTLCITDISCIVGTLCTAASSVMRDLDFLTKKQNNKKLIDTSNDLYELAQKLNTCSYQDILNAINSACFTFQYTINDWRHVIADRLKASYNKEYENLINLLRKMTYILENLWSPAYGNSHDMCAEKEKPSNTDNADSKDLRQCIEGLDICFQTIKNILDNKSTTKETLLTDVDIFYIANTLRLAASSVMRDLDFFITNKQNNTILLDTSEKLYELTQNLKAFSHQDIWKTINSACFTFQYTIKSWSDVTSRIPEASHDQEYENLIFLLKKMTEVLTNFRNLAY